MKEKIYTIPVNEAFTSKCSCPFCKLYDDLDLSSIDFILGPSYMESDIRMETNKIGFCKNHYDKMMKGKNLLGVGLMTHTHLNEIIKNIENLKSTAQKTTLLKKDKYQPISSYINTVENSCYVCNRIDSIFTMYIDTFFYLYKNDSTMNDKLETIEGFCLPHFSMLLSKGIDKLSQKDFEIFKEKIVNIQLSKLKSLSADLELYTNKFDYQYKDVPYGNSKTSIPRAKSLLFGESFIEE